MFGKMVLPLLGGAANVWNTCLVFYQATLLAGYLYAHVLTKIQPFSRQLLIHIAVMASALVFLPICLPEGWSPPSESNPVTWLFLVLTVSLGVPFFVVSSSAPTLQNWFAHSQDHRAKDPYFLYAASNAGSLAGLFSYPFLVEPVYAITDQSFYWTLGYVLLIVLVAFGALRLRGASDRTDGAAVFTPSGTTTFSRRLHWILLAFIPSSFMQSVTTYFTTDIAAVPFLWVLPLGTYLVSFVLVFARHTVVPHRLMVGVLPYTLLAVVMLVFWMEETNVWIMFPLNIVALFVIAMVFHGDLVRLRPPADRLTDFYLCMSLGGVLGGIFNAIIAPMLFNSVAEFPIGLVLAGLLMPSARPWPALSLRTWVYVVVPLLLLGVLGLGGVLLQESMQAYLPMSIKVAVVGVVTLIIWAFRRRSVLFAVSLAAVITAGTVINDQWGDNLYHTRNFFGVIKVRAEKWRDWIAMYHGSVRHGTQLMEPDRVGEPTCYFAPNGPVGQLFQVLSERPSGLRIAVVGLGAGTMASYAREGDNWVFYEIDPAVKDVAIGLGYFTFLRDCPAQYEVILGDGRLSLSKAPDAFFDLIMLDAFSSDSVPVHLLTKEAVQMYVRKLAPGGLLLFNISNKYLDLEPVLGNVFTELGLVGVRGEYYLSYEERMATAACNSVWIVGARKPEDLAALRTKGEWDTVHRDSSGKPWTDDYSNIWGCLY